MPTYAYKCPCCKQRIEEFKPMSQSGELAYCVNCGCYADRIYLPPQLCIPNNMTKHVGAVIDENNEGIVAENKKHAEQVAEMKKDDEHWNREFHRAELHSPNEGGESLREQTAMAASEDGGDSGSADLYKKGYGK